MTDSDTLDYYTINDDHTSVPTEDDMLPCIKDEKLYFVNDTNCLVDKNHFNLGGYYYEVSRMRSRNWRQQSL